MQYIGKILPIDGYTVRIHGHLPLDYSISLTHLYQPLVGMDGVMLYQTLVNESYVQEKLDTQTHHTLMNYLKQPLDILYEARLKLEGIGLLRTYKDVRDDRTYYTYRVQSPFSPEEFFKDAMLSELLYHHIGKGKFNDLQQALDKDEKEAGEEATASFEDVFQTFQPAFVETTPPPTHLTSIPKKINPSIDERVIRHALARRMIRPENILTEKNRRLISQMMDLYKLESVEISRCLTWAMTDDQQINESSFREACAELFKTKNQTATIQLTPKQRMNSPKLEDDPVAKRDGRHQNQSSRRDVLLREFETMSPAQLLADHSPTGFVEKRDLAVVEEVMNNQGLPTPVMNVLIHYVFIRQNKQLAKPYLETIASHWARAGFTTADEAMTFAQSVNERFNQAKERANHTRKKTQKEIIPDWYDEHMKQIEEVERAKEEKRKKQESNEHDQDIEKELQALIQSVANRK